MQRRHARSQHVECDVVQIGPTACTWSFIRFTLFTLGNTTPPMSADAGAMTPKGRFKDHSSVKNESDDGTSRLLWYTIKLIHVIMSLDFFPKKSISIYARSPCS